MATTLAEQVLKEAQLADEASKDRTSRKFANKLKPFVAGIEQYGGALDVLSNTNSLILCPLWGGIRVILHVSECLLGWSLLEAMLGMRDMC